MDMEVIMVSEINQKKTNTIWYHFYVESTNELIKKTETNSQTDNKLLVTKGERGWGGRDKLRVWNEQIQATIYKIDK